MNHIGYFRVMTQEILPPLPDPDREPDLVLDPDNLPLTLRFTPVPRNGKPWMGITAQRQAAFIAHLAGSGSVKMAAKSIGISSSALYQLRKAEGAESFAAAWEVAIEMGARRVLDTLMDHAIHGIPETLSKDGVVILERRKYNTRAMMWIVQQRFPEQFGGSLNVLSNAPNSLPHGLKKLKEEWRAECQKEWEAKHLGRATEEETNAAILKRLRVVQKRYEQTQYFEYLDDPAKRAAIDVLYGPKDWDLIQSKATAAAAEAARQAAERERISAWSAGGG